MRNIVILLAIVLPSFCGWAQERVLSGVVGDAESRQGLPFCNIIVEGTKKGTTTDQHGRYSLSVETGRVALIVSYIGYATDTVHVNEGRRTMNIFLKPDSKALEEVMVVSATMKEVTKMSSPIPVEVYSPAMFLKNPSPSIFESLSMVNGVQPQLNCNVCNTGDIHINGMEGPYTMLLIDGMPIVSSLATVYGLSGIPNSMVKRIEVVKGPASTLYGSEAVGGLINVITKDPITSPRFHADVSGTTVGELNADVSATLRGSKLNGLLGINYFNYQNAMDINSDNFTDVTLQRRISVFNKWDVKRKENRAMSMAVRYVYEDRWGGELQWNRQFRGSADVYGESIYTNRVEVIGNYQLPTKERIMLDYSLNNHVQDSYYGTTSFQADQSVVFAQLRWNRSFGIHDWLVGVPLRFMHYDDNTPGTASVEGNSPQRTILPGIFVQDELKFNENLTILAGLRYDHHNEHGSIISPRLSAKVSAGKNHTVRLSGGNGYRVVNLFTEEHAALTGSRTVVITEALKPEQSWNGNINYATIVDHATGYVSLDASLFYTYFTNKIVGDFATDPDLIVFDNLRGHAVSKGITVNTELSFISGLKWIGGITVMDVYQKERGADGVQRKMTQQFAPRFSATYALSYTFLKPGITIDLTGRTNGPMELPVLPDPAIDPRPSRSPTYTLLNLQLTRTFKNGLEVYGGVKNLLNFIPDDPILFAEDPSSPWFDTSYNYAPIQGIKGFAGLRFTL